MRWTLAAFALAATPALAKPAPLPEGARYVALGSSFAAGPGVGPNTPGTPPRCGRGTLNYPNLLAARLKLSLIDATCSGATTEHVLGPWNEVPPQIESVTADTRLVTVTIGGNDVNFVGNIFAAACEQMATPDARCQKWREIGDDVWKGDEERMRRIVREVRTRAPQARVVFVDYITVLPPKGTCAAVPISNERMKQSQAAAKRLVKLTAKVAREEGAEVFRFSALSKSHAPCSAEPWSNGLTAPAGDGIPIHPNRAGHEAAAAGLAKFLS
ncbi:SGNH/GDSL hydrolase family protein [Novosphingobium jiangmenense]|nr:SGNH/GDSL hydrolase family protein [Novosphingobium jiangmenense]